MLSMVVPFRHLPMALYSANSGDTDALRMLLFRGNMYYTLLMDDDDLTPTDIIKQFVRLQLAFKARVQKWKLLANKTYSSKPIIADPLIANFHD